MSGTFRIVLLASAAGLMLGTAAARAEEQLDRRDRQDPVLVVEAGGPTGNCDALTFTPDGKALLAAGDDKVVRAWPLTDGILDADHAQVLRWSIWRELRGCIYALALSPDGGRVAVGGLGARSSAVAVLDRATGKVVAAVTPEKGRENFYSVRAIAFSPDGRQVAYGTGDGSVWLWDYAAEGKSNRRLGSHRKGADGFNRIRLVAFRGPSRLLSVAEDGRGLEWDTTQAEGRPAESGDLLAGQRQALTFFRIILSPDGTWLAGASKGPVVVVRSLDGSRRRDITLAAGEFAESLAFDPAGKRLAVGVSTIPQGSPFLMESACRVAVYDLQGKETAELYRLSHSYRTDALAFHPTKPLLAIAGGNDHEVTLWHLGEGGRKVVQVVRSAGSCLWGVGLSKDGWRLGFQDQRNEKWDDPNRRGAGPWRVFDLRRHAWAAATGFEPVAPLRRAAGWSVEPSARSRYVWHVVAPDGARYPLPLDDKQDAIPWCYSFLPAKDGEPVRLAVGHYWGVSVFELTERGPRRTRMLTGHQGEVMALAVSADGDWLVSASNDQTIAAFSLKPIASGSELGARFAVHDGRLLVEAVDVGGPAWEAGLLEGDEVVLLAVGTTRVFDRDGSKYGRPVGRPGDCADALRRPVPGVNLHFGIRRAGQPGMVEMVSSGRQRPLWRFFPTRGGEWVLWMWRNAYYDCSPNGDYYVGWHVNNRDMDREPTFYKAEQLRQYFWRRPVIDKLLASRDVDAALRVAVKDNPAPLHFDRIEPPSVRIDVAERELKGEKVVVTLVAEPRSANPDHMPQRVELWINDYRFATWDAGGRPFRKTVDVPASALRAGANELTLQAYNRVTGRGEGRADASATLVNPRPPASPRLFGLAVGINDYKQAVLGPGGKRDLGDLQFARRDALEMQKGWLAQKDKLYRDARIDVLLDDTATPADVLRQLRALKGVAGPEDRLVLFLSGHGHLPSEDGGPFVFCGPRYDPKRFDQTGLSSLELYEALADLPCRKLVLVDACHSGGVGTFDPIRSLTPGGRGPTILASCDPAQESYEDPAYQNGLFAYAVLEALGRGFAQADQNGDGVLDSVELYEYTRKRLPELLKKTGRPEDAQRPVCFPRQPDPYPLARK